MPAVSALPAFDKDGKPVGPVRFQAACDAYHLLCGEGRDDGDATALAALLGLGVRGRDDDSGSDMVVVYTAEEEVYAVEEAEVVDIPAAIDEDDHAADLGSVDVVHVQGAQGCGIGSARPHCAVGLHVVRLPRPRQLRRERSLHRPMRFRPRLDGALVRHCCSRLDGGLYFRAAPTPAVVVSVKWGRPADPFV